VPLCESLVYSSTWCRQISAVRYRAGGTLQVAARLVQALKKEYLSLRVKVRSNSTAPVRLLDSSAASAHLKLHEPRRAAYTLCTAEEPKVFRSVIVRLISCVQRSRLRAHQCIDLKRLPFQHDAQEPRVEGSQHVASGVENARRAQRCSNMAAAETKDIFANLEKNLSTRGAELVEKVKVC
jgi:hypothetical protein